jgi:CHAT domain-containing protein
VTKTGFRTYELPERAGIEKSARRLYELLTAHQFANGESLVDHNSRVKEIDEQYWIEAGKLGKMILEPVSSQLGTNRLLIIADGALLRLPFSALALPASSNNTPPVPLMLEHEIVALPSASTLSMLRRMSAGRLPAKRSVMVLADPVFERNDPRIKHHVNEPAVVTDSDLYEAAKDITLIDTGSGIPRLLASGEEVEDIVRIAPPGSARKAVGFEANLDTVRDREIAQYRIIHFATHGLSNNEHPELSGVILSLFDEAGHPRPGFLRLQEIYNLDIPVELVVLSACNTGVGKEVKGEGLIGLTGAFMYAGATGVMSSLWRVDDDATAELMKYFYEGVLQEKLSPAAALRKTQMRMWQTRRWHSPYYWAAFVLHGEYRRTPHVDRQSLNHAHIIGTGVGVLVFAFLGFYLLRRRLLGSNVKLDQVAPPIHEP